MKIYGSVMRATFQNLRKNPSLFKPILFYSLLDIAALAIIYYAPQWPLNLALGQPIRAFYGEAALHYPTHLLVVPKIFSHWQMFNGVLFGSLLVGICISMYNQKAKGMSLRFGKNFKIAFNRYLPLLAYSLVVAIVIFLVEHFSGLFIKDRLIAGKGYFLKMGQIRWSVALILFYRTFYVIVQTLLIYVPVMIIIENKGFWRSAGQSIKMVFNYFISSLLLVLIPVIVFMVFGVIREFNVKLMDKFFPEISLVILLAGILIAFLANTVIIVSATILYLSVKEHKE